MLERSKKRLRIGDNEDLLTDSIKERIWGEESATAVEEEKPTEKKGLESYTDEKLESLIDAVFSEQERRKDA